MSFSRVLSLCSLDIYDMRGDKEPLLGAGILYNCMLLKLNVSFQYMLNILQQNNS